MEVRITVTDAQVRAALARSQQRIGPALQSAMRDATSYVLRQVRVYPPPPSGSTYRRTGTLARSWFVAPFEQTGDGGLIGRVVNNGNLTQTRSGIPYSRYVQDRDMQAWMHRGRWQTYQDVAEQSNDAIQEMFRARVEAAIAQG